MTITKAAERHATDDPPAAGVWRCPAGSGKAHAKSTRANASHTHQEKQK